MLIFVSSGTCANVENQSWLRKIIRFFPRKLIKIIQDFTTKCQEMQKFLFWRGNFGVSPGDLRSQLFSSIWVKLTRSPNQCKTGGGEILTQLSVLPGGHRGRGVAGALVGGCAQGGRPARADPRRLPPRHQWRAQRRSHIQSTKRSGMRLRLCSFHWFEFPPILNPLPKKPKKICFLLTVWRFRVFFFHAIFFWIHYP